jgi:hypothetical protein
MSIFAIDNYWRSCRRRLYRRCCNRWDNIHPWSLPKPDMRWLSYSAIWSYWKPELPSTISW